MDSAKNIEHVAVSGEHSQNHYIGVRYYGHPFPIPLTVTAHAEQERAWSQNLRRSAV